MEFENFKKGKKRVERVFVIEESHGNLYYSIDEAIDKLKSIKTKYKNYKNVTIEITPEEYYYGESTVSAIVKGFRRETKEEFEKRLKDEFTAETARRKYEKKQCEVLKKKFGK